VSSDIEFRLLGPLEVLHEGHEVAVGAGKRRALLALLVLHRNAVVPAERLIDELWAGRPPPTAAKSLQVQVSQLRKELAATAGSNGGPLLTRAGGYVLEVAPESVDIARFERAVDEGEQALAEDRPDDAAAKLREALDLWRGPALVDFAYESFAQEEIARLDGRRLAAQEERIDADLALGRHRHVVAELESLTAAHPLRERLRAQLMVALYRCDRKADALEAYREGRRRTVEELGLEPGPALRELEGRILGDDPDLAAPPPRTGPRAAARRGPLVLAVAGVLLAGAVAGALLRETGGSAARIPAQPALDIAANAVVGLDANGGGRPTYAVPLPGRATDLATDGERLFAVSIDSSALTIVDSRTRRLARTVPLAMRPAAVAAGDGSVWVADGRRGLLVRMDPGYEGVAARATWERTARPEAVGLSRFDPTSVALAGGDAWVTDGSSRLIRSDPGGTVSLLRAPHPLDGITAGGGALWAFSRGDAAVVRFDPETGAVTDDIPIVARPGSEAPSPIAITATDSAVWVLNGNTATVSRIDAHTRGVTATIPLALEASPRDIEAGAGAVWVSSFDGSVTRVPLDGAEPRSSFVGESLVGVAGSARHVWVAAVALDQQIPGGG
jgi:DNA-binding SARP family transcriptional activator/DNA-binding beta-propeller fold protein YncE